jgi:peroxiredoxin 2/4
LSIILDPAPDFRAAAAIGPSPGEVREVALGDYAGRWLVLVFYPRDFTPVCPTELLELSRRARELSELRAEVLAVSVDDVPTHQRWLREVLGPIAFPLAADPAGAMSRAYGAFLDRAGVAARATVIVDPEGVVQYAAFHNLEVGRSPSEILRVLEALRTRERVPAEWRRGEPTLGR